VRTLPFGGDFAPCGDQVIIINNLGGNKVFFKIGMNDAVRRQLLRDFEDRAKNSSCTVAIFISFML